MENDDKKMAVMGFGSFGAAITNELLRSPDHDITVIEQFPPTQTIKNLINISLGESDNNPEILKSFFNTESFQKIQILTTNNQKKIQELLTEDFLTSLKLQDKLHIIDKNNSDAFDQIKTEISATFFAIPAKFVQEQMKLIAEQCPQSLLVDCAKGIHEISDDLKEKMVIIMGPNFARYMRMNHRTGIDVADFREDDAHAKTIANIIHTKYLRPYIHTSPEAVKMGGIWKNVLSLVAGFLMENKFFTKNEDVYKNAEIFAGVFMKMLEWANKQGIDSKELFSLSGIGDFFMCMNPVSRNFHCGKVMQKQNNFQEARRKLAKERRMNQVTVEAFGTIQEYFEDEFFSQDPLIQELKKYNEDPKYSAKKAKKNMLKALPRFKDAQDHHSHLLQHLYVTGPFIRNSLKKLGYKDNTEALIVTRGIYEICRNQKIELNIEKNPEIIYELLRNTYIITRVDKKNTEILEAEEKILASLNNDEEKVPIQTIASKAAKFHLNAEQLESEADKLMIRPLKYSTQEKFVN